MPETCTATLTWTPYDGENGHDLPARTEHCSKPTGHSGYHQGEGGPFGPWQGPEPGGSGS